MTLFEIRGLTKVYGQRTVLDIPELDFERGEIYALLGPNGSGKTTLLEILSLLLPPTAGTIRYLGRNVDFSANNLTVLRREIVMVPQNPVLFTTSVYKNVEFGLRIRNIPRDERNSIIEANLDLVGMGRFRDAEAHKLSGGETQRVAIARALTCSPNVIFFDEPTSNVDVENQLAIERIMAEINAQKGISVIFTSHNLTQASKIAHRVVSLYEGQKAASVFENIFSGEIIAAENGEKVCLVQDRVKLHLTTERTGAVRLSIDSSRIRILDEQETGLEKNVFSGEFLQLTDEDGHIRAIVDIGIPLSIILSKSDLKDKHLYIGEKVTFHCPPDA
ncbi:ABC transporter ATP-binding protein, partial [Thermodesulfobacteriota bacterium]